MQNDQGQPVDLYIPRKCSWTNRLIGASDQASVQINVGTIDPNTGLHTGGSETYALSGYVRNKGESDGIGDRGRRIAVSLMSVKRKFYLARLFGGRGGGPDAFSRVI